VAPLTLFEGDGPFVLDSPHSGTWYPDDFEHACPRHELRRAEDTHVEKLWRFAVDRGHTLLQANFARTYIDPNRSEFELDWNLIDGRAMRENRSPHQALGMGLVWSRLPDGTPIYQRLLRFAEVAARVRHCWQPYHEALRGALARARTRHGWCLHLDCHSMPSDTAVYAAAGLEWEPADFVLGDLRATSADPRWTHAAADFLRAQGWRVEINHPFQGAELLRRHGRPGEGIHSIQIEVSRRLYMDERTLQLHDGAPRLRQALQGLLDHLQRQRAGALFHSPQG
jgi:N-formylglutamate deformylase